MSTATTATTLEELCVDTIRTLSMDAVQQAESGHPGTPMALAPIVAGDRAGHGARGEQ